MTDDEKEEEIGRRIRRASKVVALTFTLWFGAQWLGGKLELPDMLLPVLDFVALLAFVWVMIEIWGIFRVTRKH